MCKMNKIVHYIFSSASLSHEIILHLIMYLNETLSMLWWLQYKSVRKEALYFNGNKSFLYIFNFKAM